MPRTKSAGDANIVYAGRRTASAQVVAGGSPSNSRSLHAENAQRGCADRMAAAAREVMRPIVVFVKRDRVLTAARGDRRNMFRIAPSLAGLR